jgi:hypothetical protein
MVIFLGKKLFSWGPIGYCQHVAHFKRRELVVSKAKRKVLVVVMDGVGVRASSYGNAVKLAHTPQLRQLEKTGLYRTLKAHGTYVGLPSDSDIGNSEVGHNALGAGRVSIKAPSSCKSLLMMAAYFAAAPGRTLCGRCAVRRPRCI